MQSVLRQVLARLLRCFLAGVFAILPLVVTVAVVVWVTGFVNGFVGPNTFLGSRLQTVGLKFVQHPAMAYGIGWAVVLGCVFLLGVLVETGARRIISRLVDGLFKRIPLIGSVYDTSKRVVDMLDKGQDGAELKGMSVVFCRFGSEGGAGILALLVSPQVFRIHGRDYQVVIVPTAPVPVGGGLLFVPAEHVLPADMSVDGLMSIYVSMGVTTAQFLPPNSPVSEKSG